MGKIKNKIFVLLQIQKGLLLRYGWLRSWWKGYPVDRCGHPLPWITYPAIDFLQQFDYSTSVAFEWGSGFSTVWWSKRCRRVITVESNESWVPFIEPMLSPNVQMITTALDVELEIEAFKKSDPEFDLIIIDNFGSFRWRCADVAVSKLAKGGIIVVDNSDLCPNACERLRKQGLIQIDFSGFVPANGHAGTTSIFFREYYKFKTADHIQPHRSVAQPNPPWDENWRPRTR